MIRRWNAIPGWEGVYEVSNDGMIRRLISGGTRLLKPTPNPHGHLCVKLCHAASGRSSVKKWVHRAVLEAFDGPCPDGMECRHLNGIPGDNRWPENLRWGTDMENHLDKIRHGRSNRGERHWQSRITKQHAREICAWAVEGSCSMARVGSTYGIGRGHVKDIKWGRLWGHSTGDIRRLATRKRGERSAHRRT